MTTPATDNPKIARDHTWLVAQLELIWSTHFADVARLNEVTIEWGRGNRTRLGTITAEGACSRIRINPLLKEVGVPVSVIHQTIAHELAHYTHGFCSPHPQKYAHPHRGRVIEKELFARNLFDVHKESKRWLKDNWRQHVEGTIGLAPRKRKRRIYARKSVSLLPDFGKILTGYYRLGK